MEIAILCDPHFGARNDSRVFLNYFLDFFEHTFFPKLKERKINTVFLLGDLFDRRKFVNYYTLNMLQTRVMDWFADNNVQLHIIPGNHDTFFRNTLEINAINILLSSSPFIHLYTKPTSVELGGVSFLFIPWMCESNYQECLQAIESAPSETIVCGHFEITGFMMYKKFRCESGMSRRIFSKFDMVLSGHFHHKSQKGNIYYLGAPYEITFNDIDNPRGFHLLDLETKSLEFIQNTNKMFYDIVYNDERANNFNSFLNTINFSQYNNKFVRIIVEQKKNSGWFDIFLDRIFSAGPYKVDIVDRFELAQLADEFNPEDFIGRDSLTLINEYINDLDLGNSPDISKSQLKSVMRSLHKEALATNPSSGPGGGI